MKAMVYDFQSEMDFKIISDMVKRLGAKIRPVTETHIEKNESVSNVPNNTTLKAINEAITSKSKKYKTVTDLMKELKS